MKRRFPIKVLTVAIILGTIATPSAAFASASKVTKGELKSKLITVS
jgi:hypothetical protein